MDGRKKPINDILGLESIRKIIEVDIKLVFCLIYKGCDQNYLPPSITETDLLRLMNFSIFSSIGSDDNEI